MYTIARVVLCILVCTVSIMFSFCVVVREVPLYVSSDHFISQVSTMLPVLVEEVFIARD